MIRPIYILPLLLILFASCDQEGRQEKTLINSLSNIDDDSINQVVEFVEATEIPEANPIKPQLEAKYETVGKIPCPNGYVRVAVNTNSFGYYLRNSPLKTENNIVYLYNGNEKYNQDAHFAIVKMDVGTQDLQQCADAVMRLRGEYLFEHNRFSDIHFNFLSDGKPHYYTDYVGNDRTHDKFSTYMNHIFSYANTGSLKKELKTVTIEDMQIGDIFIQSGNPYGHAITVMDIAKNDKDQKIFMISQSYMPAQEIHILINQIDQDLSPWYPLDFGESLFTPEWTFNAKDLKRFKD